MSTANPKDYQYNWGGEKNTQKNEVKKKKKERKFPYVH